MATVEELDYELNFEWDKKTFDNFQKSLGGIVKGFAKLSAGVIAAQGIAFAFARGVAQSNDDLAKQSKRLNIASEDLQKLKFAAELGGAGVEDLTGSLKNLTKAQEDILRGKGDLEAFGQLGINPADFENSNDLLLAISDSISTIQSDSEKINLLERIGVSGNLLQTLENGSNAIKQVGNEFESLGGIVTTEQKRISEDFNDNMSRLGAAFGGIQNKVGSALIEPFNEFVMVFTGFIKNNMNQLVSGFKTFFAIIQKVSSVILHIMDRIFRTVGGIVDLMGGFENVVIAVGAAFIILKRTMLLTFAIPLAIATALFLIIEDIVAGLKGQDSITKDLINSTGFLADVFKAIVGFIKQAADGWDLFFTKGDKALTGLKILVNELIDGINVLLPAFAEIPTLDTGVPQAAVRSAGVGISQADIQAGLQRGLSVEAVTQIVQQAGGASSLSPNVTINVNGATDPKSVVRAINQEMIRKNNTIFGGSK